MRLRAPLDWMSTKLVASVSHCSRVTHVGSVTSNSRISAARIALIVPSSTASSSPASSPAGVELKQPSCPDRFERQASTPYVAPVSPYGTQRSFIHMSSSPSSSLETENGLPLLRLESGVTHRFDPVSRVGHWNSTTSAQANIGSAPLTCPTLRQ